MVSLSAMFQQSPRLPVCRLALFLGCGRKDMALAARPKVRALPDQARKGCGRGEPLSERFVTDAALPCAVAVILPQRGATAAFDREAPMSDRSNYRGNRAGRMTGPNGIPAIMHEATMGSHLLDNRSRLAVPQMRPRQSRLPILWMAGINGLAEAPPDIFSSLNDGDCEMMPIGKPDRLTDAGPQEAGALRGLRVPWSVASCAAVTEQRRRSWGRRIPPTPSR